MANFEITVVVGIVTLFHFGAPQSISGPVAISSLFPDHTVTSSTPASIAIKPNSTVNPILTGTKHTGQNNGAFKNSTVPKIQDQTNQTYGKLNASLSNIIDVLADLSVTFKSMLNKSLQNLTAIIPDKIKTKLLESEISKLSASMAELLDTTDNRLDDSLLELGGLLNRSIAVFVKLEQKNLGRFMLSSDTKSVSEELRSLERSLYKNLSTCVTEFNGSVISDVMTIHNMFNTLIKESQTLVDSLDNAKCPSAPCNDLLNSAPTNVIGWKNTITAALKQVPVVKDIKTCVKNKIDQAKSSFNTLLKTVPPPIDVRAIITNETEIFRINLNAMLTNFSNSFQKLTSTIGDKINLIRVFASKTVADDPKSIVQSSFRTVNTADDVIAQLIKAVILKLTSQTRRLIIPLVNKERDVLKKIDRAIAKDDTPPGKCDEAVRAVSAIQLAFNQSTIKCFSSTQSSIETTLSKLERKTNETMANFTDQITSAEKFDCGSSCTVSTLRKFAEQLKDNLVSATTFATDIKKTVTDQINVVYMEFEKCMSGAIQLAMNDFNDQTNVDIKSCLFKVRTF